MYHTKARRVRGESLSSFVTFGEGFTTDRNESHRRGLVFRDLFGAGGKSLNRTTTIQFAAHERG